jgi:hypothetical protein
MSADLIDRARTAQHSILPQPDLIKELADEIERLRAQVEAVKEIMVREVSQYVGVPLTEMGRHGRLVVGLIDQDIKRALAPHDREASK